MLVVGGVVVVGGGEDNCGPACLLGYAVLSCWHHKVVVLGAACFAFVTTLCHETQHNTVLATSHCAAQSSLPHSPPPPCPPPPRSLRQCVCPP